MKTLLFAFQQHILSYQRLLRDLDTLGCLPDDDRVHMVGWIKDPSDDTPFAESVPPIRPSPHYAHAALQSKGLLAQEPLLRASVHQVLRTLCIHLSTTPVAVGTGHYPAIHLWITPELVYVNLEGREQDPGIHFNNDADFFFPKYWNAFCTLLSYYETPGVGGSAPYDWTVTLHRRYAPVLCHLKATTKEAAVKGAVALHLQEAFLNGKLTVSRHYEHTLDPIQPAPVPYPEDPA